MNHSTESLPRRVAFELMYDGTGFFGWQRQAKGRTVQQELERMLSRVSGEREVVVHGAGRTDSGVHASGQVAHADIICRFDDRDLLHVLRRMSPEDLVVSRLVTVSDEFHARFRASSRSYRYSIHQRQSPFLVRYSWSFDRDLDLRLLQQASELILGSHDFSALTKLHQSTTKMICNVHRSEWEIADGSLAYHITADRFLYGMVRLLVGVQIDIARGKRGIDDITLLLESGDRTLQSPAAPSQGLSLVGVTYSREDRTPWALFTDRVEG